MSRKIKGLFLNTAEAKCSIYESGKMSYDCLVLSDSYLLDYQEIDENNRKILGDYDFYIFNYHQLTMGWLDLNFIKKMSGFKAVIVLEVEINNPFCLCPDNIFDAYLVLDPTIQSIKKYVYAFPRPLENVQNTNIHLKESLTPIIGSFGFYGNGKGFDNLINAVNKEFDEAIIRINTLNPDWGGDSKKFNEYIDYLNNYPTKEKVRVVVTTHNFNKEELANWCAENTLNAFFYNRHGHGLSATTDQAIASGKPLSVSTGYTFRHIHQFIKPYPFVDLRESIKNGSAVIKKIQEEWSQKSFVEKFEKVLKENDVYLDRHTKNIKITLPMKKKVIIIKILKKIIPPYIINFVSKKRKTMAEKGKKIIIYLIQNTLGKKIKISFSLLDVFIHPALHSYSKFQEDMFIDYLLGGKEFGFYIDIQPKDYIIDNDTNKFYKRGWRGLNVISDSKVVEVFNRFRLRDINLKIEINNKKEISSNLLSKIFIENLNTDIDFMSLASNIALGFLKSNDWHRFRPKIIIVKCDNSFEVIRFFMENNDYMYIYNNNSNAFFIDKFTKDGDILKNIVWATK
jgi:hypothetical protein